MRKFPFANFSEHAQSLLRLDVSKFKEKREEAGPDVLRPKKGKSEESGEGASSPDELEKFSRLLEGVDLGEGDKN